MEKWRAFLVCILTTAALSGCTAERDACDDFGPMIAGEGEQTFGERHAPDLRFPVPEREFLAAVRATKLEWFRIGPGQVVALEAPYQCAGYDMSAISHGYAMAGGRLRAKSEYYVAFVDRGGMVVLVENRFGFLPSRF